MSDEKKFDWFEYYKLAKSYNNEKNAAKLKAMAPAGFEIIGVKTLREALQVFS